MLDYPISFVCADVPVIDLAYLQALEVRFCKGFPLLVHYLSHIECRKQGVAELQAIRQAEGFDCEVKAELAAQVLVGLQVVVEGEACDLYRSHFFFYIRIICFGLLLLNL